MKHFRFFLLLAAFSSLGLHCKKEHDEPKTELEKLPPITMEGKQTFGWLANGKAIIGDVSGFLADYEGGKLSFGGKDIPVQSSLSGNGIGFTTNPGVINSTGMFKIPIKRNIGDWTYFGAGLSFIPYTYSNQFTDHGNATINIYRLDTINYYMAGTFAFTVYSQFGDSLVITDGRFDIKYH
ncbi:MAG: hypothetical protein K1X81_13930 [Bacteroidia bacterium]|nr:hypothetical protein [Bacteroidia bacterium]